MTAGAPTIGGLKRLSQYLAGQLKTGGNKVVTAQLNSVSTTTVAAITGISAALEAGHTYNLMGEFPVSTNSTAGIKFAFGTSDTLTVSSANITGTFFTASGVAVSNTTTFTGGLGSTATVILAQLSGAIAVTTAGTLILSAAQNVSTTGTASVTTNGWLEIKRSI